MRSSRQHMTITAIIFFVDDAGVHSPFSLRVKINNSVKASLDPPRYQEIDIEILSPLTVNFCRQLLASGSRSIFPEVPGRKQKSYLLA